MGIFFDTLFVGVPLQVLLCEIASAVPFLVIHISATVLWFPNRNKEKWVPTFSKFNFLIALPVVKEMW